MADVPADLRDHLALALVPGLGPKLTAAALAHFGSAAEARRASAAEWEGVPQVGATLAGRFADAFRKVDVDAEWRLIERHGVRTILLGSADYPAPLAAIPDPPALLYVRGTLEPDDVRAVGIVGSRSCTPYGKRMAERLAGGLARAGWVVVSGLARGIDGCAHRGALDAGGRTVAVLAGGLSRIYPPEHAELAERVVAAGALVTETPMMLEPQAGMFPARNRVISGLSRAVVVVEANVRSGALITVTHAADQGRDVYAVPGNADSPASAGCLELIRKGARLVRSADDILDDVAGLAPMFDPPTVPRKKPPAGAAKPQAAEEGGGPPPGLDAVQRRVWDALTGTKHADELCRELGMTASELSVVVMKLDLKKAIHRLPGNRYERH